MTVLSIDFETRSPVDLTATGVYPYAAHPQTEVLCMAWAFDDEEPELWTPGQPLPDRVTQHIAADGEMRAWNAQFERLIWREIMVGRKHTRFHVRDEQWVCSAAEAAAMALPRSLDGAASALGAAAQKDKDGYRLMMKMAKPKQVLTDGTVLWWDTPEMREKLYAYCLQDVRTERSIIKLLRRLTPTERQVYLLDQRMNDRGVRIDRALVEAAQAIAVEGAARADAVLAATTEGVVTRVTQAARLLAWVREQGHETESLDKAALTELLAKDLTPEVRRALVARAEAGRSSVKKLESMLDAAGADDRVRGMLLYHGASTGRWAGRLVQPQNFPRGDVPDAERWIPAVLRGDYDAIDLEHPPVAVVSSLLRACLTAAPGHVLVAADYSAIEARVVNWLAGEEEILDLFRRGEDVYKHNAAKLYGIPLDQVQKFPHRQTGKFQELGCGFGMGAKKAVSAAKDVYGLELTPEQAKEIVDSYRATHPKVKAFWYETEDACKAAVLNPGVAQRFGDKGRLRAVKAGGYLYILLPSGRPLCYPAPRIVESETPWSREARQLAEEARAMAELLGEPLPELPPIETRPALEFSSVDSLTKQWGRERTYGGKLVENIVQAVARDLMAEAMLRAEQEGFTPILTVHDEIVAEVPETKHFGPGDEETVQDFERVLTTLPAWAEGCPVAAEGWMGFRYRK